MAIILKVKTKSGQSVQVILVLILNEALKMKTVIPQREHRVLL